MPLLRNKPPAPSPAPKRPAYPRVLEIGALLLLGACSRGNEAPQEVPPPPHPGGVAPVLMTDAESPPPPPVSMGSVATPIVEAGAPDAAAAKDAGKDAGKKATSGASTRTPRTGGVPPHPYDPKDLL